MALFRVHQAYNLLDLNLGLCIRSFENPADVEKSHSLLARSNVQEKIERFSGIALDLLPEDEVDAWRVRAQALRLDRNMYAHAYFDVFGHEEGKEQSIHVAPWMRPQCGLSGEAKISIAAFESFAEEAESVFKEFMGLRRRAGI